MKIKHYSKLSYAFFILVLIIIFQDASWSQCTSAPKVEAVRNGDFEAGYLTKSGTGHVFTAGGPFDFQSDLTSAPNFAPGPTGQCITSIGNLYGVARAVPGMTCTSLNRQAYIGTDYINVATGFRDHTPGLNGDGFALVADFEAFGGSKFDAAGLPCAWRETVTITPNETYFFSAWFANYNRDAGTGGYTNPTLNFVVIPNVGPRVVVGTATPTGQMVWQQFSGSWPSGTATSATILIEVQQANQTNTNDLLIDDISFINSCSNLTSLPAALIPNLGKDTSICLTNGTITLDSKVNTGGGTQYWWYENTPTPGTIAGTTAGDLVSKTAVINHAGTYTICVKNGSFPTGCTASADIVVTNTMPPVTLNSASICSSPTVALTASLSGASSLTYQWYKRPAGFADPGDVQSINTSVTGTYGVKVIPSVAGCATVTSNDAQVTSNATTPTVTSITGVCSGGSRTFTLSATAAAGTGFAWWDAASGGTQLAEGSPATITLTAAQLPTTIYVENYNSINAHINRSLATSSSGGISTETNFTALQNFTLVSFWINAVVGGGCSGNVTISLMKNGAATGLTKTVACNAGTWQQVIVNWPITAGNNYRIDLASGWFMMQSAYPQTTYGGLVTISPTPTWGYSGAAVNWVIKTESCMRTGIALSCPLAVHFLSIDAEQVNNAVNVNWSASEDNDRSPYYVQRSSNGSDFTTIGIVQATRASSYTFIDNAPENGINYYRIMKGEEEGTYEQSNIVNVNFEHHQLLSVHPNPFGNTATITALHSDSFSEEGITITLTDLTGKTLRTFTLTSGQQKEIGGDLPSGTYLIHTLEGEVYKLVKN